MTCSQPNNNTPANISADAQQAALDLLNAGKAYADAGMKAEAMQLYAQAWDVLAQAGDRYADNAAGALGRGADAADNFFKTLVENHWNNTVGADAYTNQFDTVAAEHLGNYLSKLHDNNGTPPNTQDIITSYESALAHNHLDKAAAFDGAWASAVPGNTALDASWAAFLGMELSRITTSDTTNNLSAVDAATLIALDMAQTVAAISQNDPYILPAIVLQSPAFAALSPTMRAFAERFGEGAWDYLKDVMPSDMKWIVPDACVPRINPAAIRPTIWVDLVDGDPYDPNELHESWELTRIPNPTPDPLVLDLNGNGIETVGLNANNPILFDHNASGIKQGTGWVAPGDGFLVLDRNGNGVIDNGSELFGNNTPLVDANGNVTGYAVNGFAALAAQDTNLDGVVDNLDANFASLQVWQDLNQDGVSQANELSSLADAGIASFNVGNTAIGYLLQNGNDIPVTGTYTRSFVG